MVLGVWQVITKDKARGGASTNGIVLNREVSGTFLGTVYTIGEEARREGLLIPHSAISILNKYSDICSLFLKNTQKPQSTVHAVGRQITPLTHWHFPIAPLSQHGILVGCSCPRDFRAPSGHLWTLYLDPSNAPTLCLGTLFTFLRCFALCTCIASCMPFLCHRIEIGFHLHPKG